LRTLDWGNRPLARWKPHITNLDADRSRVSGANQKLIRSLRRDRTVQINADSHTLTAEDPNPTTSAAP
jgi:hypothetical protein